MREIVFNSRESGFALRPERGARTGQDRTGQDRTGQDEDEIPRTSFGFYCLHHRTPTTHRAKRVKPRSGLDARSDWYEG